MAQIVIRNLHKRLGNQPILTGLNLEMQDREFVTLLGPSGCGKTTTLRILAGFLTPDDGEVIVDGVVVSSPKAVVPPEKRRMGMVFQNYAVWPHMTVFENVAFGLRLAKRPRDAIARGVADTLRLVGLAGMEKRYPANLSGGQQQRVALARSLVMEPAILLLDEPLSNLDAKLRERMRAELKDLQRRTGITFVYVTHDQAEAMALSDRVAVLDHGLLQQYDTPRAIYERPANLFVADFMGTANQLPGRIVGITAGVARVCIGEGTTLAAILHAADGQTDDAVTVVIRPEAIRLAPDTPDGAENLLHGVVTDATFLGNLMDYAVNVAGVRLRVQSAPAPALAAGDAIAVAIPAQACVAMRGHRVAVIGA